MIKGFIRIAGFLIVTITSVLGMVVFGLFSLLPTHVGYGLVIPWFILMLVGIIYGVMVIVQGKFKGL